MATNLNALVLKIGADTSGVSDAVKLVRRDINRVNNVMRQAAGASGRMQEANQSLNKVMSAGAITADEYARAQAAIAERYGTPETIKHAAAIANAKKLVEASVAPTTRLTESLRDLIKARRAAAITADEYARASEKLRHDMRLLRDQESGAAERARNAQAVVRRSIPQTTQLSVQIRELRRAHAEGSITAAEFARANKLLRSELQRARDSTRSATSAHREALAIVERSRPPLAVLAEQHRRLNAALSAGVIDSHQHARATAALTREYGQQTLSMRLLESAQNRVQSRFGSLNPGMIAASGGAAILAAGFYGLVRASEAVTRGVSEQMTQIDEVAKTAKKLGLVSDQLLSLRFAAGEFSGMASNQVDTALQRMTRRIAEAAVGTGEARAAISQLGLDAKKLNDAGPAEAFKRISDEIKKVQNPAERLRLAFKLFDSEGAGLVTTLMAGRDALDDQTNSLRKMGFAFSGIEASAVENANDAIGRMNMAGQGLYRTIAIDLAPALTVLAEDAQRLLIGLHSLRGGTFSLSMRVATLTGNLLDMASVLKAIYQMKTRQFGEAFKSLESAYNRENLIKYQSAVMQAAAKAGAASRQNAADMKRERGAILDVDAAAQGLLKTMAGDDMESPLKKYADDQQKRIDELAASAKANQERKEQAEKQLQSIAESISEGLTTPYDQLVRRIAEINAAAQAGLITGQLASQAVAKANQEFGSKQAPIKVELPPSMTRGSKEEYQQIAKIANGNRDREEARHRQANAMRKAQVDALKQTNDLLAGLNVVQGVS